MVCTMKVSQLMVTMMYFSHRPGKEFAYNEDIFSKLKNPQSYFMSFKEGLECSHIHFEIPGPEISH